jgi:outer membrane protein OmpA-like peptidoglycan-associated protein
MQQEVTADASQIQDELSETGHMTIYGIQFETGKAAILPASEGVLAEVQKMLEQNESWRIRIEGHTDNVGQKAANQTLSDKRAQAVIGWLLAHGIDASRLTAKGYGDNRPVADNGREEGRAKNRRVELAKM